MTKQPGGAEQGSVGPMGQILAALGKVGSGPRVSLGEILDTVGELSFFAVLVTPALLVVSPLSGIPLFSSVCGLTIAVIAGQMLAQRPTPWLPGVLRRRTIGRARLQGALKRIAGIGRWIDRHATGHGAFLMRKPVRMVCELACMLCGLAMPFLELVPFSSSILGLAVILLTVAMLARDAMFMGIGAALMGSAAMIPLVAVKAITD